MEKQEYPWLSTLLSYFKTIKKYDTEIESFRSSLSSNPSFSPLALFSFLDQNLKSFITLNELRAFLLSENANFDENKLRKLIHNFYKDNDFSLNLHEFTALIQSKRNKEKKEFLSNYKTDVPDEIKTDLRDLLEKEMELIAELNEIAKEIKNSEIFSTYEAFTVIVGLDKYITKKNFGKFLNDNFMEVNEDDVNNIMFRIDADNDDKISYEEFKEIFYPICDDLSFNKNKEVINKNNNFNYNNIDIANKYLSEENNNDLNDNYENIEEPKEEENNENNNIEQENEEQNNNNIIDDENKENNEDDNNNFIPNEKKKKITKKTILKPKLKSNIIQDSESNLLHSSNPIKFNENNYINKGKCTTCGVAKKEINNNNIINKYNIEPENILENYEEEKLSNNNILPQNNTIYPQSNNINSHIHNHKTGNCKACQYMAQNIYSDIRAKNSSKSPFTSNDKFNQENQRENEPEENNINNIDIKNNEIEENYNIYKNKDALLKKYTNYDPNDNNYNNENSNDFSEFKFSTQKKFNVAPDDNENNFDNINISPIQKIENTNTGFKSKNILFSNNSSNILSSDFRANIPKNNINEKKELLYKLLMDIIEKENNIRKIQQLISSSQGTTPQNIFELFNQRQSIAINSSDILDTLNSLTSNKGIEQNDIKYIFKKYNKTISIGFTFDEFIKIIFGKNLSSVNNDEINLEENTKNLIFELFKEIINGEKEIENSRVLIEKACDNIFYDLFDEIKKENKSGIEKDDIEKFMKENGYDIKEGDTDIIMEKMDKNKDDLIDYGEFIDQIRPMYFC